MKYPITPIRFFKNISYKGPNVYDVRREKGWGGLDICHVLTYFIVSKQQIYCSFLQFGVLYTGYTGLTYADLTVFLVSITCNIFTLSESAFKTIKWCFATCFSLRIIFLDKLFNRCIMKCFLKETYGETITWNFFYEKFFLFRPSVNLSVMA